MTPIIKKISSGKLTREGDRVDAGGFRDKAAVLIKSCCTYYVDGGRVGHIPPEELQKIISSALWEVYEETRKLTDKK